MTDVRVLRVRGLVGTAAVREALLRPLLGVPFIWAGIGLFIRNPERVWFADRSGVPLTIALGVALTLMFSLASATVLWVGLRDAGVLPLLVAARVRGVWRAATPAMLMRGATVPLRYEAAPAVLLKRPIANRGDTTYPVTVLVGDGEMRVLLRYLPSVEQMEHVEDWLSDLSR